MVFSYDDRHILVDASPELRLQCIAQSVTRIDAVCLTHAHADHVAGLDDLRRFNDVLGTALDVYGDPATLDTVQRMFGYAFDDGDDWPSVKPNLRAVRISAPFELFGRTVTPLPYLHGPMEVLGYRVGDVAYCPDCSGIPDQTRRLMDDLDILILDAVRHHPHPTHFNIDQAIAEARRIGARRTLFTHIAHALSHAEVGADLPPGFELAYDGQVCESP